MNNIYDADLDHCDANYVSLSPLSFLGRVARVYPDHPSVIHGGTRWTWRETAERCNRLASALTKRNIGPGDTVSVMAPNIPALYESHFGVPMTGAVLNALNIRLDAKTLAFILEHGEAKVLITDTEFSPVIKDALRICNQELLVIDIDDPEGPGGDRLGELTYEELLTEGESNYTWSAPDSEWNAISLNYTSGTTGNPKGVVYHHRGAYLNASSNIIGWNLGHHPTYLWTLPMFHCNGWCFPWSLAAVGGTSVCLRNVSASAIFDAIADHSVTHFCGAPVVLNLIIHAAESETRNFDHTVEVMTAAAPPPAAVLAAMEAAGFSMTHVYGLTETYGPAVICAWHPEWNDLPLAEQAEIKSRQGVQYHMLEDLKVLDPETMNSVQPDALQLGEVMFRGNIVMKGYLKNPKATAEAFAGGWFHSGDLGVLYPDGYIQLKDRSKDIIISGGENISSIEIEDTLYRHPDVLEAAVVARPDNKWGETPCAFVTLKDTAVGVTGQDIINFCREQMAHFKIPKTVIFLELPKTSTGKVQKFRLREKTEAMGSL
ncbi:3-methylmercaptopropionyl-CoA ligase (DmdB) [hydrothermal vent metagenome]|uniref:3-methylmercaptopropionyl-CoA ligase (DmdB) n=1 Tax=hydrothermal vent metagenome TaxID=652676 RepID=A0A160TT53_9ZZZZ|nr:acyl-CoA synthetase [Gammaproteobacteria bacterium]PDH40636.1 MAG: acyl-CoA synthetase [Candidatus Thioglobus sp. MED-G25]